jgi:hypothetical protein
MALWNYWQWWKSNIYINTLGRILTNFQMPIIFHRKLIRVGLDGTTLRVFKRRSVNCGTRGRVAIPDICTAFYYM